MSEIMEDYYRKQASDATSAKDNALCARDVAIAELVNARASLKTELDMTEHSRLEIGYRHSQLRHRTARFAVAVLAATVIIITLIL